MSLLARIVARFRWLCAPDALPQAPPAPPPGPGLRAYFLKPGELPPPPAPLDLPERRPSFLTWLLTPETLPQGGTASTGTPPAARDRHPRAES